MLLYVIGIIFSLFNIVEVSIALSLMDDKINKIFNVIILLIVTNQFYSFIFNPILITFIWNLIIFIDSVIELTRYIISDKKLSNKKE